MDDDKTLAALAKAIEPELEPTPRLSAPWKRAVGVVPYAALCLSVLTVTRGLRGDSDVVGPWLLWGLGSVQLIAAFFVFRSVLREALPGSSGRPKAWLLALGVVLSLQIGISMLTQAKSPVFLASERALTVGLTCFGIMSMVGVPVLILGLFLASRGLPARPRIIGLVAGLAGGLLAEAVYRTHCPYTHLTHMLSWHTGAVVLLGALGFFAGATWDLKRTAEWKRRRGGKSAAKE